MSEAPDVPAGDGGASGLPHRAVVHELVVALARDGVPVREALLVRAGRWWSYDCPRPCCAPGAGTPLPDGHDGAGGRIRRDGHGGRARPQRPGPPDHRPRAAARGAAMAAVCARVATECSARVLEAGFDVVAEESWSADHGGRRAVPSRRRATGADRPRGRPRRVGAARPRRPGPRARAGDWARTPRRRRSSGPSAPGGRPPRWTSPRRPCWRSVPGCAGTARWPTSRSTRALTGRSGVRLRPAARAGAGRVPAPGGTARDDRGDVGARRPGPAGDAGRAPVRAGRAAPSPGRGRARPGRPAPSRTRRSSCRA